MKQILQNKFWLRICMLVAILCSAFTGTARADYEEVYNLNCPKSTSNTAYATNYDVTVDGVTWNAPGNQNFDGYWRIGGKASSTSSLDVNRIIKGKNAIASEVSKITINHKGVSRSGVAVPSVTLTVASDVDFNNIIDEVSVSPTVSQSTDGSFDFTPTSSLTTWSTNRYYKFTINVTSTSTSNGGFDLASIVFYKTTSASAVATTTTIDATGITNTDVYVNTAAGSLSATVVDEDDNAIPGGATVTWSSSDENVATVASDGTVTLVAAGTTNITANYAGVANQYQASSDTYELTVTSSAPYVQPTEFDIAFNNTAFGCGTGNNGVEQSFTTSGTEVVAGCSSSASSKTYYDAGHVRFYADSYLILTAPTGYNITGIVFTAGGTWNGGITPNSGTYNNNTKAWTGNASSVQFDFTAQNRIASAAITLSSASDIATTTTISATGITNTDVYVGTAAGSLAATVTAGGNAVPGATVTWSGDDDDVATIDENTGEVTLVGAGTVTFTATYAGTTGYSGSYATYEMTVTSSAPYVQPTTIEITPNYTFWGQSAQFSSSTYDNLSGSKDNVELEWTRGDGSTYANQTSMRFYKDNTLTFTAPTGYEIKSIVLTMSTAQTDLAFDPSGYDTETTTWSGSSETVTMSRPSNASSYATISKFTITIGLPSSVATPTFSVASGTYTETQNVKVSNYDSDYIYFYTTDGTTPDCDANLDPTGTSVAYNHTNGINISSTTTLKMIAADEDGNKSGVATAEYTINLPLTTIAQVKAQENNTVVTVNLTDAQVVYVHGNDIYIRDASGAIDLYYSEISNLATGDIFDATFVATYTLFKGLPELKTFTTKNVTKKGNSTVVAKTITTAAEAENLVCDLVKFENVQLDLTEGDYYIGETGLVLYDKFSAGYEKTVGKDADISGIVIPYGNSEPYTYEICPRVAEDIVYLETSEAVSISSSLGYSTYCSDDNLDFTAVDAIKVFYATVEGSTLTFHRIYKVAADTGVLLVSAAGGAVAETHVPFFTGDADDVTGNVFVRGEGTAVSYYETDQNYILFNGDDGIGFYKASNNKVATNRAYIHVTNGNGVKGFAINLEDDATSINEELRVKNEEFEGAIYNLAGQRISKMQKGINIVNGKKIMK